MVYLLGKSFHKFDFILSHVKLSIMSSCLVYCIFGKAAMLFLYCPEVVVVVVVYFSITLSVKEHFFNDQNAVNC